MSKIIYLKETVEAKPILVKENDSTINLQEKSKMHNMLDDSIMVDVEAIHSILTKNFTLYSPNALKESAPRWTEPYERPVIMHHNDEDGMIIGRVKKAKYTNKTPETEKPGLMLSLNISEKSGIEGVKSGRLLTVSIGANASDVRCSVCGKNIAEEDCPHQRGEIYDGKLCYWIVEKLGDPKEISYVIVPSDKYAKNVNIYSPNEFKKNNLLAESESEEVNRVLFEDIEKAIEMATKEAVDKDLEEKQIEEEVKEETAKEEIKVEEEVVEELKKEDEEPAEEKEPAESKEDDKESEPEEEKKEDKKEDKEPEEKDFVSILNKLQAESREMERTIIELKRTLGIEKGLKESLEKELQELKAEKKANLVEKNNNLRKQLNLSEMDAEVSKHMEIEMLEASIANYEELVELNSADTVIKKIEKVDSNISVSESEDRISVEQNKNLKEKEEKQSNTLNETTFDEDLKAFLKK